MSIKEMEREQPNRGLERQKAYYASESGDREAFRWSEDLRRNVESMDAWRGVKYRARKEIADVPADTIPKLFGRFESHTQALPAAHSVGHVKRDFISSILILQDPNLRQVDDVERFVGVMAGTFHDDGNAVVNRYQEPQRFAGHAEIGAQVFDQVSRDLIPDNLRTLCALAIAAHTHYTKDIPVTKIRDNQEDTIVKIPYDDKVEGVDKMGIWLARWADRLDAQGINFFVRHALSKAEPTMDYSQEGFHEVHADELEDFRHHFTPVLRNKEYRGSLPKDKQTMNVLEHMQMFRDSALGTSIYSQHDTPYFREQLVVPAALEQMRFVEAVLAGTLNYTDEKLENARLVFERTCRLIEPGANIDQVMQLLNGKYNKLDISERSKWTNGFILLPELYSGWYNRVNNKLNEQTNSENAVQKPVFVRAREFAREKLSEFDPQKLK